MINKTPHPGVQQLPKAIVVHCSIPDENNPKNVQLRNWKTNFAPFAIIPPPDFDVQIILALFSEEFHGSVVMRCYAAHNRATLHTHRR